MMAFGGGRRGNNKPRLPVRVSPCLRQLVLTTVLLQDMPPRLHSFKLHCDARYHDSTPSPTLSLVHDVQV